MKIQGILFILVLSSLPAFPSGTNGRAAVVNDSVMADSLMADSLIRQAERSLDNSQTQANYYATQALELSVKINYATGQINALSVLAKYYRLSEEYMKTLETYFHIIDLYAKRNDTGNMVLEYSRVVEFFLWIKNFGLAEKYLGIMNRLAGKIADPKITGQLFLSKSRYFLATGDADKAILFGYLSMHYFQKVQALMQEVAVYKYVGDAYAHQKLYARSEYCYQMAVSCLDSVPNPGERAVLYTRIAHLHQIQGNYALNFRYNLSALRIREKIGRAYFIASSCLNVGEAYWFLGKKDSARIYLQKSLQLAEHVRDSRLLEAIYFQLYDFARVENRDADALNYYIACSDYRAKLSREVNKSEILILEANRSILASEVQNDLMNQEILIQGLQIRNRRFQMFLFEVLFIILLSLILVVDAVARKNGKRQKELQELNARLTQEISIRIEAEGRLKRSEELHRFLAENTVDVISLMDAGMHRLYISPSCERFYGYSVQEILRMRTPLDLIEPSFHIHVNQHLIEMFRTRKTARYIYKVLRKDGSTFWAETHINPITDPDSQEIVNLITVVRDISERMKHEDELSENSRQKEFLLREIHNRVKNNFAILISLMNMQRNQSDDAELIGSLTDLQLRVRTMSLVHEQLYKSQEISTIPFDNYLHHLALIISSSFDNKRIRLETDLFPCQVPIEMALPLGLILNELITNAYKYAFPGERNGNISIILSRENEEKFCISISDNGIGLPQDFSMESTQSMGSQIIGILVQQIEATLEVSNHGGACFRILFSTLQAT